MEINRYISKYIKEAGSIEVPEGKLQYFKVTPVFSESYVEPNKVEGSRFLYDNYSSLLKPGDTFYDLGIIEVDKDSRRKGIGSELVKEFFYRCAPTSVVLQAEVPDFELYEQLCIEQRITEYIYENIVPFFEKFDFTDVNHTMFYCEDAIPMLWPKAKAAEAKRKSEAFKRRMQMQNEEATSVFNNLTL